MSTRAEETSVFAGGATPRVTVVIPTYNRERWLPGAIESVLAQSYGDLKLLVSDNASTDGTPDVVERFTDERVAYVHRERHLELNDHWNVCFREARTPYVFFLPDDDEMLPTLLERTVPVLDRFPRVGLVHGRTRVVGDDRTVIADGHDMTGLSAFTVERGDEFIRRSLRDSYRVHASTALIRTAALEGLALEQEDYPATDFGLWLRLGRDWDLAFLPETLAVYRIHGDSYTSDGAGVTDGGYVQDLTMIEALRRAKLRFLDAHAASVREASSLRRAAGRSYREALLVRAGHLTSPERRLRPTLRLLADAARRDWLVVLESGAWRMLAGAVAGPRIVSRIRRRRLARAGVPKVAQ